MLFRSQQAFDLNAVLKDLSKNRPQPAPAPTPPPQPAAVQTRSRSNAPSNPLMAATAGEREAIKQHIEKFWNPPVGARDAQGLVIELQIVVNVDGTVQRVSAVDSARKSRDGFFRAAAESAERAVWMASPLPIPREKYETFREILFTFDPRELLGIREIGRAHV